MGIVCEIVDVTLWGRWHLRWKKKCNYLLHRSAETSSETINRIQQKNEEKSVKNGKNGHLGLQWHSHNGHSSSLFLIWWSSGYLLFCLDKRPAWSLKAFKQNAKHTHRWIRILPWYSCYHYVKTLWIYLYFSMCDAHVVTFLSARTNTQLNSTLLGVAWHWRTSLFCHGKVDVLSYSTQSWNLYTAFHHKSQLRCRQKNLFS